MKKRIISSVLCGLMLVGSVWGAEQPPIPVKYLHTEQLSDNEYDEIRDSLKEFLKKEGAKKAVAILNWVLQTIKEGNPHGFNLYDVVGEFGQQYPSAKLVLLEAVLTSKKWTQVPLADLLYNEEEDASDAILKRAPSERIEDALNNLDWGREELRYRQTRYFRAHSLYLSMIYRFAKHRPQETAQAFIKNISRCGYGLEYALRGDPNLALLLMKPALLAQDDLDFEIFLQLFRASPNYAATQICANLPEIKTNNYKAIKIAINRVLPKEVKNEINVCILGDIDKVGPKVIDLLIVDLLKPEQKALILSIKKKSFHDTGLPDTFGIAAHGSPTAYQLREVARVGASGDGEEGRKPLSTLLFHKDMRGYGDSGMLQGLVKKVHDIQEQGYKDGYYTYIHAHTWPLDFDQRVYAELHPERLGKDFLPLHFLTLTKKEAFPVQIKGATISEDECVKILLDEGSDSKVGYERYLLSMNASFLGNLARLGESTAAYLATSRSIHKMHEAIKAVFEDDGNSDIYNKYEAEFGKLEKIHADCSQYGKLWIIKVPKTIHKQVVIPASGDWFTGFGKKIPFVIRRKKTDDVDAIQEAFYKFGHSVKDIDKIQFRLLMTPKTGLNPKLGIKTIPISLADPKCYAEFNVEFEALMKQVKADIAAKQKAKEAMPVPRAKL